MYVHVHTYDTVNQVCVPFGPLKRSECIRDQYLKKEIGDELINSTHPEFECTLRRFYFIHNVQVHHTASIHTLDCHRESL